jgi:ribonuclease Z
MGATGGAALKRDQASMSIFVELSNGDAFIFDLGIGTFKNYVGMRVSIAKINDVFRTHLHADHFANLVPVYCFGPLPGRFLPMQVYGPLGGQRKRAPPGCARS